MSIKWILAPLLGALIGFITNDLAIKMLFHPYRAKYIGSWHIPFTPGLIPAQMNQIAASLGNAVGSHLLNSETLKKEALSEPAQAKVRQLVEDFIRQQAAEESTLREIIGRHLSEEEMRHYSEKLRLIMENNLIDRVKTASLGRVIARKVVQELRIKLRKSALGFLVDDNLLVSLEGTIASALESKIVEYAPDLIHSGLRKVEAEILDVPVCTLLDSFQEHIPAITDTVMRVYVKLVNEQMDSLLENIQINAIITRKIASFDPEEFERLAFGIIRKELNAIICLGGILGFVMGFTSLLF